MVFYNTQGKATTDSCLIKASHDCSTRLFLIKAGDKIGAFDKEDANEKAKALENMGMKVRVGQNCETLEWSVAILEGSEWIPLLNAVADKS